MVYYKIKPTQTGKSILEILGEEGIMLKDTPCGGRGKCGKCLIRAKGCLSPMTEQERLLLSDRGGLRLACLTIAEGDFEYELPEAFDTNILTDFEAELEIPKEADLLAVDIGTTTVALYRIKEGRLTKKSFLNPQREHGADVISRLEFANNGGAQKLKASIVNAISAEADGAEYCVISANTVMEHFVTGMDASGIAALPFTPASLFGCHHELPFAQKSYIAPCVSAYVGGDITCGAIAAELDRVRELTLYIDIGTNGEIVLCDSNRAVCCAAAAGPAFEGANIECGSTASTGAISKVRYEDRLVFETVDMTEPSSICGSGLIDTAAALLDAELLDETGRLEEEKYFFNERVYISQKDIRALQLAKAAIAAGIKTLLYEIKRPVNDIKKVIIAGGFGMHIDPHSAARIGLIPAELEDRIEFSGNCAGLGAIKCGLDPGVRDRIEAFAKRLEYIELSGHKKFNELYIEEMMFE